MKYNEIRRNSREVRIGSISIGGKNRLAIQSMTNTDTHDAAATVAQIRAMEQRGCDIVRISVPTLSAAETITAIKEAGIQIPIVADIHFDYKIALRCAELGVDKIRINPGNIGDDARVKAVCDACRLRGIPIRIGRRLRRCAKVRFIMRRFLRNTIFTILLFPLKHQPFPI